MSHDRVCHMTLFVMLSFSTMKSGPTVHLQTCTGLHPCDSYLSDIMASWTLVFSNVLNEHKDSFVAAKGNSGIRARILKTIKDAIGSSEAAKDPCVMLPEKNLRKVSFYNCVLY